MRAKKKEDEDKDIIVVDDACSNVDIVGVGFVRERLACSFAREYGYPCVLFVGRVTKAEME
jgi:hypothetical protein